MSIVYLSIPSFPDPQNTAPIAAYGKVTGLSVDFLAGSGTMVLGVYRSVAALTADPPVQPIGTLTITAGGRVTQGAPRRLPPDLPGKPTTTGAAFPAVAKIQADQAQAWGALWTYLLTQAAALDGLKGATVQQA